MELCTPRLILKPLEVADVDWLHALWTLPEVRRYLWDGELVPRSQTREMIVQSEAAHKEKTYGLFSISACINQSTPFGFTGFWPFFDPPQIQLICGLDPACWGKGYAHEASRAIIEYGKTQLGMEKIIAATDPPNQASIRAMERLGMRRAGEATMDGNPTLFFEI